MLPRYWRVERLMYGEWLATDFFESGADAAEALADARRRAEQAGWEDARLGPELTGHEARAYCRMAWLTLS